MKIYSNMLTTCSVTGDGEVVELGFLDDSSKAVSVQLPFDQAESLVMTLPHLLARALKTRTGLESTRYVFHVGHWSIERTEKDQNCLILTLATADGFEVSFAVPLETCCLLGAHLRDESDKAVDPARSTNRTKTWKN